MAFDGVLFDLDGLLLDTEAVGMEAFADVTVKLGMARSEADALYLTLIGGSFEATRDRLAEVFPGVDMDVFDRDWTGAMGRRLQAHVPMRPTAWEVVTSLSAKGVRMVVVTSSRRKYARLKLERVGLLACLEGVICADDVTLKKPEPEPYLAGAAVLGVSAARCAAFEDSDTGTRSARAAGCATWQIPDLRPKGRPFPEVGQLFAKTLREAVEAAGLL